MKRITFLIGGLVILFAQVLPARADAQPTPFEKALYDRARYQILSKLSDEDFAAYCVTMNVGGDTLLKLHDEILAKQTEQADLVKEGFNADHPQMIAINAALNDLRAQYAVKINEARKGLEIESNIAEATLGSLPPSR